MWKPGGTSDNAVAGESLRGWLLLNTSLKHGREVKS